MRTARRVVGTRLFLVSYTPLWIIFLVLSDTTLQRIAFLALSVYGLCDAFRIVSAGRRRSSRYQAFTAVSDKSGEAAGYLASYLLPFIAGPPDTIPELAAFLLYLSVAWAIFVPTDLVLVNPTLYLLGWRVVRAVHESENGRSRDVLLVCHEAPCVGLEYRVGRLMGGIGYVVRADPPRQRPSRPPG